MILRRINILNLSISSLHILLVISITTINAECQVGKYREDTAFINRMHLKAKSQFNPDSAIRIFREAEQLSRNINYNDGIANSLMGIGLKNVDVGKYEEAIQYFEKARPFCLKSNHKSGVLALYFNNTGLAYFYKGDYVTASANYHDALKEINSTNKKPTSIVALIYNNLATIQIRLDQLETALIYLNKAEEIAREGNFENRLAMIYGNKGLYFSKVQSADSAEKYYRKSLELAKKIKNSNVQAGAYVNLGDILIKKEEYTKSIPYFLEAIKISDVASLPSATIIASYSLGDAYYNLERYAEAEFVLVRALRLADSMKMQESILEAYTTLASIYKATHQYEKEAETYQTIMALKDSLMSTEKTKAINNLEVKYRTAEKDKQLALGNLKLAKQQRDIERKNTMIIAVSAGIILVIALLVSLYRSDRHKQKMQAEKMGRMEREQEIGQLKSVVKGEEKERARVARELHDGIVGLLSAIRMNFSAVQHRHELGQAADFKEAMQQLADAGNEVRQTAYNLMPEALLQGGLAEAVTHYCDKMSASHAMAISFNQYGTIPQLDPDFELSAYRIIQELIQNIIKHAEATEAIVQLNYQEGQLDITVEDNGKGVSEEILAGKKGMGLQNLATRVKAFNGHMELSSKEGRGTIGYVIFDISEGGGS